MKTPKPKSKAKAKGLENTIRRIEAGARLEVRLGNACNKESPSVHLKAPL